ncbi:MAG: hypothetical protein OXR68_06520 [Alphaproteobacteria bacterium]|nr:hypothetical protein [Alphaproteobacteria bacterium]MDD9920257.1 hypothetical protein [Alphaproteobacteria bacterium]
MKPTVDTLILNTFQEATSDFAKNIVTPLLKSCKAVNIETVHLLKVAGGGGGAPLPSLKALGNYQLIFWNIALNSKELGEAYLLSQPEQQHWVIPIEGSEAMHPNSAAFLAEHNLPIWQWSSVTAAREVVICALFLAMRSQRTTC